MEVFIDKFCDEVKKEECCEADVSDVETKWYRFRVHFCRAFVDEGWAIVDILESFNDRVKALVTNRAKLPPGEFFSACQGFVQVCAQRLSSGMPEHPYDLRDHTPDHITRRIRALWHRTWQYSKEPISRHSDGQGGYCFTPKLWDAFISSSFSMIL